MRVLASIVIVDLFSIARHLGRLPSALSLHGEWLSYRPPTSVVVASNGPLLASFRDYD